MTERNMRQKNLISQYMQGIWLSDQEMVRQAIDAGVNINAPHPVTGSHALEILLLDSAYLYTNKTNPIPQHMTERLANLQIVRMIINQHPCLTEQKSASTFTANIEGRTLVDRLLSGAEDSSADKDWVDTMAQVVIEGIHQDIKAHRKVYQMDMNLLFSGFGGSDSNQDAPRPKLMKKLETIHSRVRERLENPSTAQEIELATKPQETIYWRQMFQSQATSKISRPNLLYVMHAKQLGERCIKIFQRYSQSPRAVAVAKSPKSPKNKWLH